MAVIRDTSSLSEFPLLIPACVDLGRLGLGCRFLPERHSCNDP